jgi:hypothetical protein
VIVFAFGAQDAGDRAEGKSLKVGLMCEMREIERERVRHTGHRLSPDAIIRHTGDRLSLAAIRAVKIIFRFSSRRLGNV